MKDIFKTTLIPIVLICVFSILPHCIGWGFLRWYSVFVVVCSVIAILLILINKHDFYARLSGKEIGYGIALLLYIVISEILTLSIAGIVNGVACPIISSYLLLKKASDSSEKAAIILSNPINHIGILIFAFALEFVLNFNDSFMKL